MAIWTPHLGTPRQFLNHRSTFGTGLCILFEEFHSLHSVGVTFVPITNLFITVLTKVSVTETTKPILIHKTFTFLHGAFTNKLFGWLTYNKFTPMSEAFQLPVTLFHIFPKIQDILGYWNIWCDWDIYPMFVVKFNETPALFINYLMYLSHGSHSLNFGLSLGHTSFLPLK
jgi:hypothetical protein